jgi:type IV secretory pathway VirB10-like protein
MTERPSNSIEQADEMPTINEDKPHSKRTLMLVVGLLGVAVILVLGSVMLKSDNSGTIKRQAEEFALRNAHTPSPPTTRESHSFDRQTQNAQIEDDSSIDKETEKRMQEMAQRMAQAELARRAEDNQREKDEAKKRADDAQKKLEARRGSAILISNNKASSGDSQVGHSTVPRAPSSDPFAQFDAQRNTALRAREFDPESEAGVSAQNQPYAFLPDAKAARIDTVAAGYSGNQSYRINQGKFIAAVLETAIQSDLPGMLRAMVQEDVYSEDGAQILIPAGSRLIGEYRSGLVRGQTRVAVIWHRVARPDGVDIGISSPGTDPLGVTGLTGEVDSHFFERFGGSVLLSLIDVYGKDQSQQSLQVISTETKNASSVALQNSINIPPTIFVDHGTRIQVFVARDINFQEVLSQGFKISAVLK